MYGLSKSLLYLSHTVGCLISASLIMSLTVFVAYYLLCRVFKYTFSLVLSLTARFCMNSFVFPLWNILVHALYAGICMRTGESVCVCVSVRVREWIFHPPSKSRIVFITLGSTPVRQCSIWDHTLQKSVTSRCVSGDDINSLSSPLLCARGP